MVDDDNHEREPIQIDLYGVRLGITSRPGESTPPQSWREVWAIVHKQLRGVVTEAFGLVVDTLRGARSLVRGIGVLPMSLAKRIESAHQQADQTEQQLRSQVSRPDVDASIRELVGFLRNKQVQGFTVRVAAREEGLAICFLPPAHDDDASMVLHEATSQLLDTQTNARVVDPALRELLAKPIEELDLSVRSAVALQRANIRTISDLVQRTERDMFSIKNFGRKSLNEIKDVLASLGLSFGMRSDWPMSSDQQSDIDK
jgi:hypothetical protein